MDELEKGDGSGPSTMSEVAATGRVARTGLYTDPSAAVTAVNNSYNKWTSYITQRGFELSMAVIGANWATFGSINPLLRNTWAKFSIGTIVTGLVITIFGTWLVAGKLKQQVDYAESDPARWETEFKKYEGQKHPWPYTQEIEWLAASLRLIKMSAPLVGGIFFVFALIWP